MQEDNYQADMWKLWTLYKERKIKSFVSYRRRERVPRDQANEKKLVTGKISCGLFSVWENMDIVSYRMSWSKQK